MYRLENKIKIREHNKQRYAANKEKVKELNKKYYTENKKKIKELKKQYYIENREKKKKYERQKLEIRYKEKNIPVPGPKKSWKSARDVRIFLEHLAEKLHVTCIEDWYRVSTKQLTRFGG